MHCTSERPEPCVCVRVYIFLLSAITRCQMACKQGTRPARKAEWKTEGSHNKGKKKLTEKN